MSYTVEQVNQANKECELLGARDGGFVNPNYGGNTNCSETNKPMEIILIIIGISCLATIIHELYTDY
jgi:hypothetical protein|tara:strand:+ start:355 stop:555 length:201 start_codon:yes stop_codon:yes gene_type:complete